MKKTSICAFANFFTFFHIFFLEEANDVNTSSFSFCPPTCLFSLVFLLFSGRVVRFERCFDGESAHNFTPQTSSHHHFVCVLTRLYSITYIHENEKNLGKDSLPFLATKQKCSSYFFVFVVVVFFWCSSSNDDFEDDDVSGKISSKR